MPHPVTRRTFLGLAAAATVTGVAVPARAAHAQPPVVRAQPSTGQSGAAVPAITQTVPGNVFVVPQRPAFGVSAVDGSASWRVVDFWGTEVASGAVPTGSASLRLPVSRPGHYQLEVSATGAGQTTQTSFAVLSPFDLSRVEDSAFGVNTHFGQTWPVGLVNLVAAAGVKNVRDEIRWDAVEVTPGTYTFPAGITGYMSQLQSQAVDPLIILDYTNPNYDGGATPSTDAGRAGFADYGAAVLQQFPGQIAWCEVSNEFNLPSFGDRGGGPADALPSFYFELLKATYERVKAQDQSVTVVGCVTDGVPLDWLEQVFELGGLDFLDAVSVHIYFLPDTPEQTAPVLAQLRQLIARYTDRAIPIWITEQGFPTFTGTTGVSPVSQAMYAVRGPLVGLSAGVEKYFWYDFMNDGTTSTQANNQGFVLNTDDPGGMWAPKPSYSAYAAMVRQLTGLTHTGDDQISGAHSARFTGPGAEVRAMWTELDESRTVAVSTDRPVVVTDLMGVSQTLRPSNGRVYLSVSGDPMFVDGSGLTVEGTDKYRLGLGTRTALVGDQLRLELTVDNTVPPKAPVNGVFSIGGVSVPVAAPSGTAVRKLITLPAYRTAGLRKLIGQLRIGNATAARLGTWVDVVHPLAVSTAHVLADGADALKVNIANISSTPVAAGTLTWTIGGETGTSSVESPIPAGGSQTVEIDLSGLAGPGTFPLTISLPVPMLPRIELAGSVQLVAPSAVQQLPRRTITVDGRLDDLSDVPSLGLATTGVLGKADGFTGFGGATDLSGDVWITWDDDHLYLSAQVIDNDHYQPYLGFELWEGDSIQLGVAPGLPGESQEWYDFTLALTPTGPTIHGTHSTTVGPSLGTVPGAKVAITRDDSAGQTTYEAAIPWTAIGSFDPGNGLLSLSVVINDNDGQDRHDWIRWGGGIVNGNAELLNPAAFNPAALVS